MTTPFTGLTRPALASNYLSVSESNYPGGLRHPKHGHDPAYITAVVEGAYDERIGHADRDVVSGALLFHPAGEEHAVHFTAPHTRVFRLEPRAHMLAESRLARADLSHACVGPARERTMRIVLQLRDAWRRPDPLAPLTIDALACELIAAARVTSHRRGATNHAAARRVRELLDACITEPPSLAELAHESGCHPVTLARAFRQVVGCSIGAYVRHRRLELAGQMLRDEATPISIVALRAGFADQPHATRALRRATGLTPIEIRRLARVD